MTVPALQREATASPDQRLEVHETGRVSEFLSVLLLTLKGYRVLTTGWRCRGGDVDIVALSPKGKVGSSIVFVDVKCRRDFESPAASRKHERRSIRHAADAFVEANPRFATVKRRFDVMLVEWGRLPLHVTDVWGGFESVA
jgi:putative endonuclease